MGLSVQNTTWKTAYFCNGNELNPNRTCQIALLKPSEKIYTGVNPRLEIPLCNEDAVGALFESHNSD